MMDPAILRILDAAANRAREAVRVLEDAVRFVLNDPSLTEDLKRLRHDLAAALKGLPMEHALLTRDTPGDVGTSIKAPAEMTRSGARDLIAANAKRLSEALRSLEECAKTLNPVAARQLEQLRYRGYTVEQTLLRMAGTPMDRFRQVRLYILLTEALCHPAAGGWDKTLDAILRASTDGGVRNSGLAVQLREKSLGDDELLRRAGHVVAKCRAAGAISVINDRPDIALLAGADGVHLGQTDLPCSEVRKLTGPDCIMGVSTDRIEQARQALRDGATYVAVGPMFPTATKEKPRIAGPAYASEALAALAAPIVAIGGISLDNLHQLMGLGVKTVAVSSAVISAPDPCQSVREFLRRLLSAGA